MRAAVKRQASEDDILDWLSTIDGFLEGLTDTGRQPTELYDWQKQVILAPETFIIGEKSRRVGWSWCRALRGLAKAHLEPGYTGLFISLNLEESKRKIRYARQAWETMPSVYRSALRTDNKTELEFANGSRLIALHEPRGEGADVDIDEMAHFASERQDTAYTGSSFVIARGGSFCIGSTPLGQGGRFYDIAHAVGGKYKQFRKFQIYWWDCPALCIDVPKARRMAPRLTTEERVERFGTEIVKGLLDANPLEDFQQEMELLYIDERTSYFPYELILPATEPPPDTYDSYAELRKNCRGQLYAGFDVGRRRNTSELTVFEKPRGGERVYERLFKTYDKTAFDVQQADLEECMTTLSPHMTRLSIDETGIGMMLSERLAQRFGSLIEPMTLTGAVKEQLAVHFRVGLEKQNIRLYPDRERIAHLHSIKRSVLPSGALRFDAERNEKHHADKAWSQILGYWAAVNPEGKVDLSRAGSLGMRETMREMEAY